MIISHASRSSAEISLLFLDCSKKIYTSRKRHMYFLKQLLDKGLF